jgi:hypothetical protein
LSKRKTAHIHFYANKIQLSAVYCRTTIVVIYCIPYLLRSLSVAVIGHISNSLGANSTVRAIMIGYVSYFLARGSLAILIMIGDIPYLLRSLPIAVVTNISDVLA